jgi:exodeoxyribonuclease VII small subunit
MAKSKGNFETSLSTLERIVAQLESGDLPLERALELFEEGVGLAGQCQSQLQEAERKVELLLRERGEIKVVPFDNGDPSAESEKPRPAPPPSRALLPNNDEDKEDDLDDAIPF